MAYEPVSWSSGESIALETMQQMTDNDQWLYDRSISAVHIHNGAQTAAGIRILSMTARIKPGEDENDTLSGVYDTIVYFPSGFFSPNCFPVVNVTMGAKNRNRSWTHVRGIGGSISSNLTNWPDASGCWIRTTLDPPVSNPTYALQGFIPLHITAIGFAEVTD